MIQFTHKPTAKYITATKKEWNKLVKESAQRALDAEYEKMLEEEEEQKALTPTPLELEEERRLKRYSFNPVRPDQMLENPYVTMDKNLRFL